MKYFLNGLFHPVVFTIGSWLLFGAMIAWYRVWTRPKIALSIFGFVVAYFVVSCFDQNFLKIMTKPDNIPIASLIFVVGFFVWWALRQAAVNDDRLERGEPPRELTETDDRILAWPDWVYTEVICMVVATIVLVVWSIVVKAPLEEPANPGVTPNPSKAPWYFLGLQEMLVYFDPWIAGVLLPTMIITGLIVIPYCDRNPRGVGYYTLRERPFAVPVFLFGFIILWISLILMGTFLRGPNWNFFGPYEAWDVYKVQALNNVNLSEYFWIHLLGQAPPQNWLAREWLGIVLVLGYLFALPPLLAFTWLKKAYKQLGFWRYNLVMIHLLVMSAMIIKMVLRWTINLKYVVFIPEYFFNI